MRDTTHRYEARLIGQRLLLVDVTRPQRMVADFTGSELPAPMTAMLANRCARTPEMIALLIDVAQHFQDRPKAARKADTLPRRVLALLRELEMDGWVLGGEREP